MSVYSVHAPSLSRLLGKSPFDNVRFNAKEKPVKKGRMIDNKTIIWETDSPEQR